MNPLNRLISALIIKRKKKIFDKHIKHLKSRIEVKKIIECANKGGCLNAECAFFKIKDYD